MMALDEILMESLKLLKFILKRAMNRCTKFQGNTYNSCWDILHPTNNVNLLEAPKEKSEDHQSFQDSSSGNQEWVY